VAVGKIRLLTSLHARYLLSCGVRFLLKIWIISLLCLACAYNNCSVNMQDTFRGRVCECPVVKGVKFIGDGYTHCEGMLQGIMIHLLAFSFLIC
jgi:hypothetical protein